MKLLRGVVSAFVLLAASCSTSEPDDGPPTLEPDIDPTPVDATFQLRVDLAKANEPRATLEPIAGPVAIAGAAPQALELRAAIKKMPQRQDVFWLELYFENKTTHAIRDAKVAFADFQPSALYDFTVDPYAGPASAREIDLGGVAKDGVGRLAIGLPNDGSPLSFSLKVHGTATARTAASSAPLAVAPDGSEVWIAVPDSDLVAIVDTRTDARIGQVAVARRPMSVAMTPDGRHVIVASATANVVSVIDRPSRQVVQTFTEADGIGREPRNLVVSPDGGHAFVSAFVGDSVTSLVRRGTRFHVETTVAVGRRPTGLSVSPDSSSVVVAHFLPRGPVLSNEAWVTVVAASPLAVVKEVGIRDPFNLDNSHCFADTVPVSPKRVTAEATATRLAGFFMNPAGSEGWVPGARIAPAAIVERGPRADKQLTASSQPRPGEISAPTYFLFDTRHPLDTDRLLSPGAIERPGIQDYIRCGRFQLEIEMEDREVLPKGEQVNRFSAFATFVNGLTGAGASQFIGFTRGGRRALIVAYGSDEIELYDGITHSPSSQRHFALSGSNPTGIVSTPDGTKAYVSYDNSLFTSVLDVSAYASGELPMPGIVPYDYRDIKLLPVAPNGVSNFEMVRRIDALPDRPSIRETAQVQLVDSDPVEPILRRGKTLFYSANPEKYPTLSKSSLGACASCHPDGGTDGSVWATMEGERRTLSLRGGVGGRGWLHASATHQDVAEFVPTIVTERLGGNLDEGDRQALEAYVSRGVPRLQGPSVDAGRAERGRTAFERVCSGCHAGSEMTSGVGANLHDVGTATATANAVLGPYFESILPEKDAELLRLVRGDRALGPDDPLQLLLDFRPRPARPRGRFKALSLTNVWDNVLFFHDGSRDSLLGAIHYMNEQQQLGLGAADEDDIEAYLKTR